MVAGYLVIDDNFGSRSRSVVIHVVGWSHIARLSRQAGESGYARLVVSSLCLVAILHAEGAHAAEGGGRGQC